MINSWDHTTHLGHDNMTRLMTYGYHDVSHLPGVIFSRICLRSTASKQRGDDDDYDDRRVTPAVQTTRQRPGTLV